MRAGNVIEIQAQGRTPLPPQQACDALLELDRWPEFRGYAFLPGVRRAEYRFRAPEIVGSRIYVINTDGSAHIEEIIEWDAPRRAALRFHFSQPPLSALASRFIETWEFRPHPDGTEIIRGMALYPKGLLGRLMLRPIALLMKKALQNHLRQMEARALTEKAP